VNSRTRTITATALAGTGVLAAAGLIASRLLRARTKARSPAPGRFIEVDGVRLHLIQQGSGPDVLLIHGAAMMASEMVLALGETLSGYRITAIDRPGHGYSAKQRKPSAADQARLFHAAAKQLGLRAPVLVGHSLGGAVALAYGALFPKEVTGVVAVAPLAYPGWGPAHLGRAIRGAPVLGPLLSNTTLALTDPLMMRAALRPVFAPQKPPAAFKAAVDVDVLAQPSAMVADGADFTRASLDLQGLARDYADYPAPLHVVVGGKDRILKPARQAERLARAVPGAQLTVRADLGHMVHHFDPEAVRTAVAEVRARNAAAEAPALAA
jgi:pimeloyl-ACP methyl ester carboxylesterase